MTNEPECSKCGDPYTLDDRERASHGMCFVCASVYAERLEGALELISRTSSKDVERIKSYAKKILRLHGPQERSPK
jgi:hypothetical protein